MDGRRYHTTISHSRIQAYTRRPVSDVRSHNRTFASYVSNRQAQVQAAVVPQPKESRWQLRAWLARWRVNVSREQRLAAVSWLSAGLIVISVFVPVASVLWQGSPNYDLSSAKSLLTATPKDLQQKLQYDAGKQSWLFNQAAQPATGSNLSVGSLTYSASLPTDLQKGGLSLTDTNSKVSLGFVPQFATAAGRSSDGHIVYPLSGSQSQLVYTLEKAGVKEDIVLYKAPGNSADYRYQLQLPDSLTARLQSDGSIGIYGGDPSLFGNISYGSDKDKALVEKARQHSTKDHLYYAIPAPVVKGTGSSAVKAHFTLTGSTLTIHVDGLAKAHYPLSIDPSFVMNTTNCGWQTGNNEDNAIIGGCQVTRNGPSGAQLNVNASDTSCGVANTWCAVQTGTNGYNGTGDGNGGARMNATLAYNGYLYAVGGNYYNNSKSLNTVSYAAINSSDGSIGSWTVGSTLVGGTALSSFGSVVYNGYLYVIGGMEQGGGTVHDTSQYALICTGKNAGIGGCSNTAGSVGTWTATSSVFNDGTGGRGDFAAVAYNGYMYAIGGIEDTQNLYVSSVIYAPILGNGDLGTWTATASLPTAGSTVATVYNGHVYVGVSCDVGNLLLGPGGCTATNNLVIGTIASDGSITNWTATGTPTFPVFNKSKGSPSIVATQGYLYVVGGNSGGTMYGGITYVTPIYANGSVGAVQTTASLSTATGQAQLAAYNGYLYQVGGYPGTTSYYTGTQYAKISTSPGGISGYTSNTINSVSAIRGAASVAYGGYIYLLGGSTSMSGGASTQLGTVQYAKVNPDGSLGSWTTSSTSFNQVQTGTGTFCATAGNCPGRVQVGAAAANGYLYIAGGNSNGSGTTWGDVQSAPINPTTGAPGTWTTQIQDYTTNGTTYNNGNGILGSDMELYNGYMYLIGGAKGAPTPVLQSTVYYAPLTANGGVGTFTTTTALPFAARSLNSFVNNNNLYVVGGNNNSNVYFIGINSDGTLASSCAAGYTCNGNWIDANAVANGGSGSAYYTDTNINFPMANFSKGYLYVSGGSNGGAVALNSVVYAKMNANGSFGTWSALPSLATGRFSHGQVIVNGYLYIMGGCGQANALNPCNSQAQVLNDVQYAQIYNGGGGADTNWASTTALPTAVFGNMAVAANGYLYNMGGCAGVSLGITLAPQCTALRTTVSYAKINADGTLGAWATTNNMVDGDYLGAAVTYGGRIYVIGGCNAINSSLCTGTGYSNGVQFATICTGVNTPVAGCTGAGATSAWQYTYNNTTAASYTAGNGFSGAGRWYISAAASNAGYIYIAGGANANTTVSDASQVQYAKVNTDGTLGTWTNASVYSGSRVGPGLVVNGGYLYVLGGSTTVSSGTVLGDVQYASLNGSTGAVGTWSQTTGLAQQVIEANCEVLDGYLYAVGGAGSGSGAAAFNSTTQYAPIFANGTLGNWTTTPGYTNVSGAVGRAAPGAIANGYIYSVGGWAYTSNGASYNILSTKEVYYGALQSTPAIAHYSMQLNTDQPTSPVNFFTDTSPEANSVINFGFAGATVASPVFGSPSTTPSPTDGKKYPLSIAGDGISYYWLPITIDDSQSMAFGESSGSKITYFQLNYHPNSSMRLRGGKTFNGQQLQSLDAY